VRLARFLALPWVRYTLLVALAFLYSGWIGYQWLRNQLFDFNLYYISAYGFVNGVDVYGMVQEYGTTNLARWAELAMAAGVEYYAPPYRYPPLTAQLIVPLLNFPVQTAGTIWLALTAVAYLLSAWWLGKLWTQPEGPSIVYLVMLGFVPTLTTLHAGQVTGFVLFALTAAMVGIARRNRWLTGFALAVATLLKLLPLALICYLGWRKQWLAVAVAVLSMVAIMLTAPLMFGDATLANFGKNFLAMGEPGVIHATAPNQGISGVLARFLSPALDTATIYRIYMITALLFLFATIALCWPMGNLPAHWRLEYSLIICTLMLIPPYNWYHMLVLLAIPLVIVVEQLWRKQQWGLLAIALVLYVATDIHGLFFHRFESVTHLTSFPFVFVVFLWGVLAWAILGERRVGTGQRGESGTLAPLSNQPSL
jgi:hypothetical protein